MIQGNRISATNVHLKLTIATFNYQTSANPYVRDSNHRGKRLKIFKRDRPYRLPPGSTHYIGFAASFEQVSPNWYSATVYRW
ncbi:hypothetical protein PGTDC60_0385 [Porphyromonas gingivalis TDC60]|nr:hypothetical protein PGTDC60_0385 [Porphyromonas gingivalis TDC60]